MNRDSFVMIGWLLTTALIVSACSGGSGRSYGGGGLYCDANQAAAFDTPINAQKVSLSPGDSSLPQGQYVYDRADFLYVYKPDPTDIATWVIIQASENNYAGEKPATQGTYCLRGILPETPAFSAGIEGVNEMSVAEDGSITYQARQYAFSWDNQAQRVNVSVKALGEDVENPSKVYNGKATEFEFYKTQGGNESDNSYEISSETHYPEQNLSLYLKIRMVRKPLTE